MHYKIWDKTSSVIVPTGKVYSPEEWANKYPMTKIEGIDVVIADATINGSICIEFESFVNGYRSRVDFTGCTKRQDYIDKINEYEDNPVPTPVNPLPSTDERTAAALEALVMLQMDDVQGG